MFVSSNPDNWFMIHWLKIIKNFSQKINYSLMSHDLLSRISFQSFPRSPCFLILGNFLIQASCFILFCRFSLFSPHPNRSPMTVVWFPYFTTLPLFLSGPFCSLLAWFIGEIYSIRCQPNLGRTSLKKCLSVAWIHGY